MKKEKNTDWIYYVFILLSTAILFRSNERMAIYMQNVFFYMFFLRLTKTTITLAITTTATTIPITRFAYISPSSRLNEIISLC